MRWTRPPLPDEMVVPRLAAQRFLAPEWKVTSRFHVQMAQGQHLYCIRVSSLGGVTLHLSLSEFQRLFRRRRKGDKMRSDSGWAQALAWDDPKEAFDRITESARRAGADLIAANRHRETKKHARDLAKRQANRDLALKIGQAMSDHQKKTVAGRGEKKQKKVVKR